MTRFLAAVVAGVVAIVLTDLMRDVIADQWPPTTRRIR